MNYMRDQCSFSNSTNEEEEETEDTDKPQAKHLQVLLKKFGHKVFRPMQWAIINTVMHKNNDVVAIMATGYGKSLCYQFPSVYTNDVTIVISPLISLMEDQVWNLQFCNIPACLLGTAQSQKQQTFHEILENKYRIVYITPELCLSEYGEEVLKEMKLKLSINLIAIDEAHCISSWGHDFRHSYKKLYKLREYLSDIPILAMTATATPKVEEEIIEFLKLKNPKVFHSGFDRPNLYFSVSRKTKDIMADLSKIMIMINNKKQFSGPTIIYCISRKQTENIAQILNQNGYEALVYHAGLPYRERKKNHENFLTDKCNIIVATIAFGMGIDKPDIRNIVHYGTSSSLEAYYQEIGRAGRDGLPSKCILFYNDADFVIHRMIWDNSECDRRSVMLDKIKDYLKTDDCRREYILKYFNDKKGTTKSKGPECCDNCLNNLSVKVDEYVGVNDNGLYNFTESTKILLSSIDSLNGNTGVSGIIKFLKGRDCKSKNKQFFGYGKNQSEAWWKAMIDMMLKNNYLMEQSKKYNNFTFSAISLTEKGGNFVKNRIPNEILLKPPKSILNLLDKKVEPEPSWVKKEVITLNKSDIEQSQSSQNVSTNNGVIELQDKELYKILLKKRKELAGKFYAMPFSVASDTALMEMANKKPTTIEQLKEIKVAGLNEARINKYGEDLLQVIRTHCVDGKKSTIKEELLKFPLFNDTKNDALQNAIYYLYSTNLNVEKISQELNLSEEEIKSHLLECLKLGYPIKLSVFGINGEIFKKIKEILDTYGYDDLSEKIETHCQKINYIQKLACFYYIKIRKHLNKLKSNYEEFDEYVINDTATDCLELLVQGLKDELKKESEDEKENLFSVKAIEQNDHTENEHFDSILNSPKRPSSPSSQEVKPVKEDLKFKSSNKWEHDTKINLKSSNENCSKSMEESCSKIRKIDFTLKGNASDDGNQNKKSFNTQTKKKVAPWLTKKK